MPTKETAVLEKAKEERELLVALSDIKQKEAATNMEKADTLRRIILMGQDGEEWKAKGYWSEEELRRLLKKLLTISLDL